MTRPVLLVAGGSRGIGAAIAKLAGARGYDVAVNYRSNEKAAQEVVAAVNAGGGLFLLAKGTHEIHNEMEGEQGVRQGRSRDALVAVIAQIAVIDLVFSIDSIVTAIGLADDLEVMVVAVVIAMVIMYFAAGPVGDFIAKHPTTKMLALSFLLLIGMALIADGFHFHIPRGYIYAAMAFAALVEVFNVLAQRNRARRRKRK
jgi:predicted tellurium resistance membrane protein TerC